MLLSCSVAWAEDAEQPQEEQSAYLQRLVEGHRLFANNEHEAALRAYQAALEERADDAMATYLIGCAHRAMGSLDDALAAFQEAARLAGEPEAALQARALFNVAMVQEARRELEAAREAWRAYIAFAESHQSVPTYAENARQRLGVITAVEELDAAYAPVRQRIAERQASEASEASEE